MINEDRIDQIEYFDLPMGIRDSVPEENFLCGFICPYRNSVVCWVVDENNNSQKEVEWLLPDGLEVLPKDRLSAFPSVSEVPFGSDYVAIRTFSIDGKNNCVVENLRVHNRNGTRFNSGSQYFFSPARLGSFKFCDRLIKEQCFSDDYSKWSEGEKVNFWATKLYMLRRQSDEYCDDEKFFTQSLLLDMLEVDPEIRKILKAIMLELSEMEHVEKDLFLSYAKHIL